MTHRSPTALTLALALALFGAIACQSGEATPTGGTEEATAESPIEGDEPAAESEEDQAAANDHDHGDDHDDHDHGDHDHGDHDHGDHDHGDHDHAAHDDHDHGDHDHGDHAHAHDGHDHAHDDTPGNMDSLLEPGDYDPADLVAQPGASVGDATTCLVSGEVFRVTEDSPFIEHEGETVYFCCSSCIRRFQRDPDTYLSGGGAEAAAGGGMVEVAEGGSEFDPPVAKSQIPDGTWICDMGTVHYAATESGSCPLCGMRLTEHNASN